MVVIPPQKLYIAPTMFAYPHISVASTVHHPVAEQSACARAAALLPFSLLPFSLLRPYLQRLLLLR